MNTNSNSHSENYSATQNNKYNINYGEGGNFGRPSNKVRISFIPIFQTEEQIKHLVTGIQPIKNIQLLFDHVTGKSKGVCLVTFADLNGAESCIRNLHKMPMGKRYLKCEYYNEEGIPETHVVEKEESLTFTMQGRVVTRDNVGMDLDVQKIASPFNFITSYIEASQLADKKNQFFLLELLKQESNNVNGLTLNLLQQFPQLNFLLMELLIRNDILSTEELKQKVTLLRGTSGEDKIGQLNKNSKLEQLMNVAKVNGLVEEKASENTVEEKVDKRKVKLLKKLLKLSKDEIDLLSKQDRFEVYELQQRAARGDFN